MSEVGSFGATLRTGLAGFYLSDVDQPRFGGILSVNKDVTTATCALFDTTAQDHYSATIFNCEEDAQDYCSNHLDCVLSFILDRSI